MIPKTCPITDKMKLHETLSGKCQFACNIPDKFCFGCSFYEAKLKEKAKEAKSSGAYWETDWKSDDRGW